MARILTFRVGEERFGFTLDQVQEVVEGAEIHYVPRPPRGVSGAINLHGTVLAVVDLARHFDLAAPPAEARLVVIDPAIAAIAVQISRLEGVSELDSNLLLPPVPRETAPWLQQRYDHADGVVHLLDPLQLLESLSEAEPTG